MINLLQ